MGDAIHAIDKEGNRVEGGRVTKLLARKGTGKVELKLGRAGDIVQVAGLAKATVSHTVATPAVTEPLPAIAIDPPTLAMTFCPNDSPLAGKDKASSKLTSQMIRERLASECENNVAITVKPSPDRSEAYDVMGRGELQLGILVENMRREGFELGVCPPQANPPPPLAAAATTTTTTVLHARTAPPSCARRCVGEEWRGGRVSGGCDEGNMGEKGAGRVKLRRRGSESGAAAGALQARARRGPAGADRGGGCGGAPATLCARAPPTHPPPRTRSVTPLGTVGGAPAPA